MSNEITVVNDLAVMPVMDLGLAESRRSQVIGFVKSIMIQDTDFGIIPGTTKPTLLKPGAEKLATFFGLTKRFDVIDRVEDWTGKDHNGEPFFYYLYRCALWRGDLLVAESDGSCNSFEVKYRWRKAERVCPECGQATIIKGKAEYGGGWLCWKNKGGCGAKFKAGDQTIESQEVGRAANPDIADQVNTFQKMAQKRALIAATLLAVNASEFFTQDLDDFVDVEYTPVTEATKPPVTVEQTHQAQPPLQPPEAKSVPQQVHNTTPTDIPNSPKLVMDAVKKAVGQDYYKAPNYLHNTIGSFPKDKDLSGWADYLAAAIAHAELRIAEKSNAPQANG